MCLADKARGGGILKNDKSPGMLPEHIIKKEPVESCNDQMCIMATSLCSNDKLGWRCPLVFIWLQEDSRLGAFNPLFSTL